jgi:hypothetical protein
VEWRERVARRESGTNFAESLYLGLSVVAEGRLSSVNEAPDPESVQRTDWSYLLAFGCL